MKTFIKSILLLAKFEVHKLRFPIPRIFDRKATSALLAKNSNLSMLRYGDGELGLALHHTSIGFQQYDPALSKRLHDILVSESDPNILICIPGLFSDVRQLKQTPREYWANWIIHHRAELQAVLPNHEYGDSLISRLYLPWVDVSQEMDIVENLKKTWHQKAVTIVEGSKTRWGVGNDLLSGASSVKRILCPSENAFAKYKEIYTACLKHAPDTDVFILALGPTATVLAFDLAKAGHRTLDLGHFDLQYEYLVQKADARIRIEGKYNNEISDIHVSECIDADYQNSISEVIRHDKSV